MQMTYMYIDLFFLDAQLDTPWVNNQVYSLKISPPCIANCTIKDVLFERLRKPVPTPGIKLDPEHKLLGQGNHGTAWISCSFETGLSKHR